MRRLHEADRPAIEAFLQARIDTSMFPLGNLARHGMAGGHPHAMTFWGAGDPLEGVLGLTESGMVLPQLPPSLAPEAVASLSGHHLLGIVGDGAQVAALQHALGPSETPPQLDREEALLSLDLADLRMPATEGLTLAPLHAAPRDLLVRWRAASDHEIMGVARMRKRRPSPTSPSGFPPAATAFSCATASPSR